MKLKAQVVLLVTLVSGSGAAQEVQRLQIFGGYSLAYIAPCGTSGGNCGFEGTGSQGSVSPKSGRYNGWNTSATYFFARHIGITADFGGYYGQINYTNASTTGSSTYTILFGPTWAARFGRVSPFAHLLLGVESVHLDFTSGNGFALAPGGGVDYSLRRHVKLRLAQFDYLASHQQNSAWSSGFRYSGGFVFNF
jgi:hypothetical protein